METDMCFIRFIRKSTTVATRYVLINTLPNEPETYIHAYMQEDFYKGIEKEILEMMKKYEKDLDEETSTKAMNACIESRVQCVLCTLRGEKIDFQGFKSRIDKYFAEDLIPEYPGVDNFMAEVTYNKNRETLLKCLMKGESYVLKYAKSFFNDTFFIKSFKTRVIEALDMIESVVKGKPELLKIYESLGSDEETKSLASIANVIRKAHNSPVVAPQKEKKKVKKSAKKETKKKTPVKKRAPLEESTSSQITQDEEEEEEKVAEEKISEVPAQRRSHKKNKENAPRSSSKKKRKVIVLQEDAGMLLSFSLSLSLSFFLSFSRCIHTFSVSLSVHTHIHTHTHTQ
jgi:hypothetical protein